MKKKTGILKNRKTKQKLTYLESPPREHKPNETKVGDETPEDTTQSYAEDNVVVNPHEVTDKRSLIENPEEFEKSNSKKDLLPNTNYGFANRKDSEEINRHEDEIGTNNNNSQTNSDE